MMQGQKQPATTQQQQRLTPPTPNTTATQQQGPLHTLDGSPDVRTVNPAVVVPHDPPSGTQPLQAQSSAVATAAAAAPPLAGPAQSSAAREQPPVTVAAMPAVQSQQQQQSSRSSVTSSSSTQQQQQQQREVKTEATVAQQCHQALPPTASPRSVPAVRPVSGGSDAGGGVGGLVASGDRLLPTTSSSRFMRPPPTTPASAAAPSRLVERPPLHSPAGCVTGLPLVPVAVPPHIALMSRPPPTAPAMCSRPPPPFPAAVLLHHPPIPPPPPPLPLHLQRQHPITYYDDDDDYNQATMQRGARRPYNTLRISKWVNPIPFDPDDGQQQVGEQELATKMLQIQSKRFYIDVKQNRRGRFMKVAEIGADGRRNQVFLALSTAAEFREHLTQFSDFYSNLGPPNPDTLPEDGKLKSETMVKDNRRYYLDLKENSRGRFLRVSQTIARGGPRCQIAIPAQGMIEFRDALQELLDEFGTDDGGFKGELPEGRHMRVENKNFYFDIGQNNRGIYMRISEVKTNFRTAITIPEKSWSRFRDIFSDYVDKMKEGSDKEKATPSGESPSSSPNK
uniref:Transcriptional activator protein Pur-beta-like n=1 Tax=Hirondellea gigas TaxID=1518452 RepID=A0A2P2HX53_9CRUS